MKTARKLTVPVPGQRIFRTMVAVWLCLAVYLLRGHRGLPTFAVLAAIAGIQPYYKDMQASARRRMIGNLTGLFWGMLLILMESVLLGGKPDERLHFFLVGLFVGMVIYFTVLLNVKETANFSAVVFFVVAYSHVTDDNPWIYCYHRLLDTMIGVAVAWVVNHFHLPRRRNTDVLYVSSLQDTILGRNHQLSPYSKVELNRLMDDGAKLSIATTQTQATVRELLGGVELRCPIITMDGAALYDMQSQKYLITKPMSTGQAKRIMDWAHGEELPFFSTRIQDNLFLIYYASLANDGMRQLFEKKCNSPYRNFIPSETDVYEDVLCLLILDTEERVEAAYEKLLEQPWTGEYRIVKSPSEYAGFTFLKVFEANTSRESLRHELERLMGTRETVTFGSVPGKYDVCIEDADRDRMVKELKRRFEPVDIRGWRNILRR